MLISYLLALCNSTYLEKGNLRIFLLVNDSSIRNMVAACLCWAEICWTPVFELVTLCPLISWSSGGKWHISSLWSALWLNFRFCRRKQHHLIYNWVVLSQRTWREGLGKGKGSDSEATVCPKIWVWPSARMKGVQGDAGYVCGEQMVSVIETVGCTLFPWPV